MKDALVVLVLLVLVVAGGLLVHRDTIRIRRRLTDQRRAAEREIDAARAWRFRLANERPCAECGRPFLATQAVVPLERGPYHVACALTSGAFDAAVRRQYPPRLHDNDRRN